MQAEFNVELSKILREELSYHFDSSSTNQLYSKCRPAVEAALEHSTSMDCIDRMHTVAESCTAPLVNLFLESPAHTSAIQTIPAFRKSLAARFVDCYSALRRTYLNGGRGLAPASRHLNKTRALYEYVRIGLGVKMHGKENLEMFDHKGIDDIVGMPGGDDGTLGENITRIYEVSFSNRVGGQPADI